MIVEGILLGFLLGLGARLLFKKRPRRLGFFTGPVDLPGLWLSLLGGLVFLLVVNFIGYFPQELGQGLLRHFGLLHGILLFLMGIGFFIGGRAPGKVLAGLGFFMNGLVVLINGKMPVDLALLARLGQEEKAQLILENRVLTHGPMAGSRLGFLGDGLAYDPWWREALLMSPGDIFIGLGLMFMVFQMLVTWRKESEND
ncbi:MAG: DUF5317 family protein [Tissierellia bacterium]|nr:DUF5317 family protein [Tissierellia bacterium]